MAESKNEQIKTLYLQLNASEKIKFHRFLEEQENKERDELKKMREELFSHFEKTGVLAKDYFKKLFTV